MVSIKITNFSEEVESRTVSGSTDVDLSLANTFKFDVTGDITINFTNVSSSPPGNSVTLILDSNGNHNVTWPSTTEWPFGEPGVLGDSEKYMYTFITVNGGSSFIGLISGEDIK